MSRRDTGITMLAASGLTVLGSLPPFLLGAQAVLIQPDLGFGPARLGLAVSAFFTVAAIATVVGIDPFTRLPANVRRASAGALVALGALLIAFLAESWPMLMTAMAVLGLANAACQGTANAAVAVVLPRHRRGLGFGIKQSAVPAAIMFGGLAVPTTTVLFGWRSTYVILGVLGLLVAASGYWRGSKVQPPTSRTAQREAERAPRTPLLQCAVAVVLASAAANFLGAYLASWAHDVGMSVGQAGILLAAGSSASVVVRIVVGYRADRRYGGNLPVVAGMTSAGALFLLLIGALPHVWTVVLFGILAFALGWSWPGLMLYAVARVGRDAPTQASSTVQAGAFTGGAIGPAMFGLVVSTIGFQVAWFAASGAFALAALLVILARHGFRRDLQARPPAEPFGYGGGRDKPRFSTGG